MGVAVRTTVGTPRFFKYKAGMENCQLLAPHGIFGNDQAKGEDGSWKIGERMYEERMNRHSDDILSELTRLQELHEGRTLVLLCFENVHKLGDDACHRRWAARWFEKMHGLVVPEIPAFGSIGNTP